MSWQASEKWYNGPSLDKPTQGRIGTRLYSKVSQSCSEIYDFSARLSVRLSSLNPKDLSNKELLSFRRGSNITLGGGDQ